MAFKALHLNRIGSGESVRWILTCSALYVGWFSVCLFWWFICAQNSTSIPKATVRDHGVGVKVLSKSNQLQCQTDCLHCYMWGQWVYRNILPQMCVFEYKLESCMYRCPVEFATWCLPYFSFSTLEKGGRECSVAKLCPIMWHAAHTDLGFSFLS